MWDLQHELQVLDIQHRKALEIRHERNGLRKLEMPEIVQQLGLGAWGASRPSGGRIVLGEVEVRRLQHLFEHKVGSARDCAWWQTDVQVAKVRDSTESSEDRRSELLTDVPAVESEPECQFLEERTLT